MYRQMGQLATLFDVEAKPNKILKFETKCEASCKYTNYHK